jgi:hypothetical protein
MEISIHLVRPQDCEGTRDTAAVQEKQPSVRRIKARIRTVFKIQSLPSQKSLTLSKSFY